MGRVDDLADADQRQTREFGQFVAALPADSSPKRRSWSLGGPAATAPLGQLRPGRFDLTTLVHQLVAASAIAERITIDGPRSLTVDADPAIIEWILLTARQRGQVCDDRPGQGQPPPAGDMLRGSVADAGPGVSAAEGTPGDTSWAWVLDPQPDGTTRLISRVRSRYRWLSPSIAFSLLLEFADVWMMRRMLLNLRERVEAPDRATTTGALR